MTLQSYYNTLILHCINMINVTVTLLSTDARTVDDAWERPCMQMCSCTTCMPSSTRDPSQYLRMRLIPARVVFAAKNIEGPVVRGEVYWTVNL